MGRVRPEIGMKTGQKRHPRDNKSHLRIYACSGTILSTLCASKLFLLLTLLTANVGDFSSCQLVLQLFGYQLGILQFSAVLTLLGVSADTTD